VDRLGLLGVIGSQVIEPQHAARFLIGLRGHARHGAAIESVRAVAYYRLERMGHVRLRKEFARARRLRTGQQSPDGRRILQEHRQRLHIVRCRPFAQHMPVRRRFDGGLQQCLVILAAILLPCQIESGNGAGDGNGVWPGDRYFSQLAILFERGQLRRRSGAIEEHHAMFLGDIRQHEAVAAESRLVLFHHGGHIEDSQCGIHGIAAGPECIQSGHRLERMLSRHHAMRALYDSPPVRPRRRILRMRRQA
jgi:hypothetical protein